MLRSPLLFVCFMNVLFDINGARVANVISVFRWQQCRCASHSTQCSFPVQHLWLLASYFQKRTAISVSLRTGFAAIVLVFAFN